MEGHLEECFLLHILYISPETAYEVSIFSETAYEVSIFS